MTTYERYRKSSLDTSSVGLINGSCQSEYACTPIGAKIIAWSAEQNGLHFCHISGFSELVFAVDPFAPPGDSVHPVAENLLDFISLVCVFFSIFSIIKQITHPLEILFILFIFFQGGFYYFLLIIFSWWFWTWILV
jgi:hypothetical protein